MKNLEVEICFPLKNAAVLKKKLNKIARAEKKDVYQKDVYYLLAHRDFTKQKPIDEWLRLRRSARGDSINYKHWHNAPGKPHAVSCDEFETKVEDISSLEKILKACDFQELVTVAKYRSTWFYQGVEIALDEVRGLGTSIELEAKGKFASIAAAKKHLYFILEELGADVGEQDFMGYPWRLLEKRAGTIKSAK